MSSGGGLLEGLSCRRCRVGMLYCYKESVSSLESWGQASSWRGKECCDQDRGASRQQQWQESCKQGSCKWWVKKLGWMD